MSYTPALTPPPGAASAVVGALTNGAKQGAGQVRSSTCLNYLPPPSSDQFSYVPDPTLARRKTMKIASRHPFVTAAVICGAALAAAPQIATGLALTAAGFGGSGVMASTYLLTHLLSLRVTSHGIVDTKYAYRLCRGRGPRLDWKCRSRERFRHPPERGCGRGGRGGGVRGCAGCWGGSCGGCCWGTVSVGKALS